MAITFVLLWKQSKTLPEQCRRDELQGLQIASRCASTMARAPNTSSAPCRTRNGWSLSSRIRHSRARSDSGPRWQRRKCIRQSCRAGRWSTARSPAPFVSSTRWCPWSLTCRRWWCCRWCRRWCRCWCRKWWCCRWCCCCRLINLTLSSSMMFRLNLIVDVSFDSSFSRQVNTPTRSSDAFIERPTSWRHQNVIVATR